MPGVPNLRLLGVVFAIASLVSCRVDRAIEAEDSWFYSRRPTQYVRTPVGQDTLHWTHVGQGGDTLVLVHGFGPYPSVQWQPVVWKFADRKHLVVVDLLGFGQSTSPDTAITVQQQVDVLHSALHAHGITRFTLMGHSYGGMVSALYASTHPEDLKALVLIDPLHRHFDVAHLDSLESRWGRPIEEVLLPRDLATYDAMMSVSVHDPFFLPDFMKQQVLDNIYSVNLSQREAMLHAVRRDSSVLRATAVGTDQVPTLLLWGAEDALFPRSGAAAVQRDFPRNRLAVIERAGHIPHMERPFAVFEVLEAFFTDQFPK